MQARKEEQPDEPIRPGSHGCHWYQWRHDHRQEQPENSDQELRWLVATKNGCRQSATFDDSDDEDAFDPDEVVTDERLADAEQPSNSGGTEQRWAIHDRPRRKITSTKNSKYKDFICD